MAEAPICFTVEPKKQNVVTVLINYDTTFEQPFLLVADRHWDNPHSDQDMQIKHLDRAKKIGAGVLEYGDTFCAMQGKYDKRSSKDCIRPEHCNGEYLDSLVDTATEFFDPYVANLIMFGYGNHETSIKGRHETDLIKRLVDKLNLNPGANVHAGGYTGWVRFIFTDTRTRRKKTFNLWYMHGWGGGGPVTKGVIQTARRAAYIPDANIIATGHIHERWDLSVMRDRIDDKGRQYQDEQVHIQLPTYKDEYGTGEGGWHVETGKPPKPIGASWLTFHKREKNGTIDFDVTRAK